MDIPLKCINLFFQINQEIQKILKENTKIINKLINYV